MLSGLENTMRTLLCPLVVVWKFHTIFTKTCRQKKESLSTLLNKTSTWSLLCWTVGRLQTPACSCSTVSRKCRCLSRADTPLLFNAVQHTPNIRRPDGSLSFPTDSKRLKRLSQRSMAAKVLWFDGVDLGTFPDGGVQFSNHCHCMSASSLKTDTHS
jgi:hypothetical protein